MSAQVQHNGNRAREFSTNGSTPETIVPPGNSADTRPASVSGHDVAAASGIETKQCLDTIEDAMVPTSPASEASTIILDNSHALTITSPTTQSRGRSQEMRSPVSAPSATKASPGSLSAARIATKQGQRESGTGEQIQSDRSAIPESGQGVTSRAGPLAETTKAGYNNITVRERASLVDGVIALSAVSDGPPSTSRLAQRHSNGDDDNNDDDDTTLSGQAHIRADDVVGKEADANSSHRPTESDRHTAIGRVRQRLSTKSFASRLGADGMRTLARSIYEQNRKMSKASQAPDHWAYRRPADAPLALSQDTDRIHLVRTALFKVLARRSAETEAVAKAWRSAAATWQNEAAALQRERSQAMRVLMSEVPAVASSSALSRGTRRNPPGYDIKDLFQPTQPAAHIANVAQIPPLMLDAVARDLVSWDDRIGLISHPLDFYDLKAVEASAEWSLEEHKIFFNRYKASPKQFGYIADGLSNRTPEECVLHYYLTKSRIDYRRDGRPRSRGLVRQRGKARKSTNSLPVRSSTRNLAVVVAEGSSSSSEPSDSEAEDIGQQAKRRKRPTDGQDNGATLGTRGAGRPRAGRAAKQLGGDRPLDTRVTMNHELSAETSVSGSGMLDFDNLVANTSAMQQPSGGKEDRWARQSSGGQTGRSRDVVLPARATPGAGNLPAHHHHLAPVDVRGAGDLQAGNLLERQSAVPQTWNRSSMSLRPVRIEETASSSRGMPFVQSLSQQGGHMRIPAHALGGKAIEHADFGRAGFAQNDWSAGRTPSSSGTVNEVGPIERWGAARFEGLAAGRGHPSDSVRAAQEAQLGMVSHVLSPYAQSVHKASIDMSSGKSAGSSIAHSSQADRLQADMHGRPYARSSISSLLNPD